MKINNIFDKNAKNLQIVIEEILIYYYLNDNL